MSYAFVKTLHVLGLVLLFGTGLGSAFHKWMADRSGQVHPIAVTNRHVVLADWLFTTPTLILQPLSGWWLAHRAGWSLGTPWIGGGLALYTLAGVCWLPVVWLQIRMRAQSDAAAAAGTALPASYWRLARAWFWLGVPAFASMVGIVALMVAKPALAGAPR